MLSDLLLASTGIKSLASSSTCAPSGGVVTGPTHEVLALPKEGPPPLLTSAVAHLVPNCKDLTLPVEGLVQLMAGLVVYLVERGCTPVGLRDASYTAVWL